MQTLTLTFPRPHPAQRQVLREARRFNVLACGRRWGKTTLMQEWDTRPALEGYPVAWFAPNYKYLTEAWRDIKRLLSPVVRRSSEQEKRLELITGGVVECWTLDDANAGRSRKYKRVVIDEAGLVKGLAERWNSAIRPTLADYSGDMLMGGTPKGRNDFFDLWQRGQHDPQWNSWRMPTEANPFIHPDEVAEMRASMPALAVAQEIDAEFTDGALNLFSVEDIDRAAQPYEVPRYDPERKRMYASDGTNFLTTVDVGRRRDATVINVFEISQAPYRRAHFERLERVPYPFIQQTLKGVYQRFGGRMVVESNGVGDPLIENTDVPIQPFVTTARSKVQALQGLQLLFEQGRIRAQWDARERAALIGCSWDDDHTADEVMSLAIFAASVESGFERVTEFYRRRAAVRAG